MLPAHWETTYQVLIPEALLGSLTAPDTAASQTSAGTGGTRMSEPFCLFLMLKAVCPKIKRCFGLMDPNNLAKHFLMLAILKISFEDVFFKYIYIYIYIFFFFFVPLTK
jgi:hypothetical protein